jgi:hypothetical protein
METKLCTDCKHYAKDRGLEVCNAPQNIIPNLVNGIEIRRHNSCLLHRAFDLSYGYSQRIFRKPVQYLRGDSVINKEYCCKEAQWFEPKDVLEVGMTD